MERHYSNGCSWLQNLNLLTKFLSMLPCTVAIKAREVSLREPAEFQVRCLYRKFLPNTNDGCVAYCIRRLISVTRWTK